VVEGLGGSLRTVQDVSKVSAVGTGMRAHTGVAGKMFRALADAGVNIKMITTGDIKISVLVDKSEGGKALAQVARPLYYRGQADWVVVLSEPLDDVADNVNLIERQILIAGAIALLVAAMAKGVATESPLDGLDLGSLYWAGMFALVLGCFIPKSWHGVHRRSRHVRRARPYETAIRGRSRGVS